MKHDPTKIDIEFDPTRQYMAGLTSHGNHRFRVPFVSHIEENLYVGGCEDGLILPRNIEHVVSLYKWEKYTILHDVKSTFTALMYDANKQPDRKQLDSIATLTAYNLMDGPTLVHCQAGLNRSNLVAAYTLVTKFGFSPDDAIDLLRAKRCEAVLCNRTFEKFILGLTSKVLV